MSTCVKCGLPIRPDEAAFHRSGVPVLHQRHYQQGYTPRQAQRWSELLAEAGMKERRRRTRR